MIEIDVRMKGFTRASTEKNEILHAEFFRRFSWSVTICFGNYKQG